MKFRRSDWKFNGSRVYDVLLGSDEWVAGWVAHPAKGSSSWINSEEDRTYYKTRKAAAVALLRIHIERCQEIVDYERRKLAALNREMKAANK